MSVWWNSAPIEERTQLSAVPSIRKISGRDDLATSPYDPTVRDTLLEALFASGSNILLLPLVDVFGWSDRINDPAPAGGNNWSYRLPWLLDRLDEIPEARERQRALGRWVVKYRR
jgi:4-alpha-glucanotransferase